MNPGALKTASFPKAKRKGQVYPTRAARPLARTRVARLSRLALRVAMSEGEAGAPDVAPPPTLEETGALLPPAAADSAPAASTEAADPDADADAEEGPITVLWCSGDAPGSTTQHNFEGVWNLDEAEPTINGRPHYNHTTPDKTTVNLFFVEHETQAPPGRAPRWMIGPTPGNGVNGWAYADSDAGSPENIIEPWLAWFKETSSWGEARLGFKERSSALGTDDDEEEEEGAEAEGGEGSSPGGAGGSSAKKKKKKKKPAAAGQGGSSGKATKKSARGAGKGATGASARGPKPAAKSPAAKA